MLFCQLFLNGPFHGRSVCLLIAFQLEPRVSLLVLQLLLATRGKRSSTTSSRLFWQRRRMPKERVQNVGYDLLWMKLKNNPNS